MSPSRRNPAFSERPLLGHVPGIGPGRDAMGPGVVEEIGDEQPLRLRADPPPLAALEAEIKRKLTAVGLRGAEVAIAPVGHLPRQDTGKLKRFVPLRPAAVKAA
jgi:hypothetical protein